MKPVFHLAALGATLCTFACSSSDGTLGQSAGPGSTSGGAGADSGASGAGDGAGAGAGAGTCDISTDYLGDEFCIPPPDPSEGIQLRVGPTDYDDPDAVEPYLLEAGGEDVVCFNTEPIDGDFYYLEQRNRMRSGSHHMLIGLKDAQGREAGPVLDQAECEGFTDRVGSVPGSQTPENDFLADDFAPEDEGLGRYFPPDVVAQFQLHYVNTTQETVMREAWINLYYRDADEVKTALNTVFLVGDLSVAVPPGAQENTALTFSPELDEPVRVFELVSHSHAHSQRFSVWRNRGTPDEKLIYESFDWAEPHVMRYNSIIENPEPDPVAKIDGGVSGILMVQPGDTVDFECEVNNTTDQTLHFANEAYTAEMCLLAGSYVSNTPNLLSGPCFDGTCQSFSGSVIPGQNSGD